MFKHIYTIQMIKGAKPEERENYFQIKQKNTLPLPIYNMNSKIQDHIQIHRKLTQQIVLNIDITGKNITSETSNSSIMLQVYLYIERLQITSLLFVLFLDQLAAQIDCLVYNNNSSYSIDQAMHSTPDNDESPTIPGYNYQSLFRKKSHIRLARKKQKEQNGRRNRPEPSQRESKNVLKGHWSQQENKLYHFFLEIHSRHFVQRHLRRSDKIFKSMAAFVGTREAQQCRSHHQKMQKKYLTFYQILTKLRLQFFSSIDSHAILEQIQARGLICKQDLVTGDQLKNGQRQKEKSQGQHRHDLDESSGASVEHADLMGEDYERQLDMIAQFGERK